MKNEVKKLVTHNGRFHADDVFASAALSLLLEKDKTKFTITRTRDEQKIKNADYVYDVGAIYNAKKNRFDHHQRGYKEKRKNGILYSSFGLIWKKFGVKISGSEETKEFLDKILVEQIDANDNGIALFKPLTEHTSNYDISSVVSSFLPERGREYLMKDFNKAVTFAKTILRSLINQHVSSLKVKAKFDQAYKKSKNQKLLIVDFDLSSYYLAILGTGYKNLLYVVSKDGDFWKVGATRKRVGSFESKKNLPKKWSALRNEDLQKVTGVKDAVFCHRNLHMAAAKSKEGAIKLAQIALES
ncbi:MYG1 family protein [Candidatus Nomurabacteria bacterium]|nr:MYG1 family protein [Candidatus Nomurabacteria bacterium]